ncbi:MAG: TetR/AcrR family transcriptional regulator [Gemmatimonadaceae bacterium]|nr:TetR/AcrR family transcriptional regulator [Gemmatimonadaceae bacterium]
MTNPTAGVDNSAPPSDLVRQRIVEAAAALIASGGRDAATTRAVATAASVQAPTIYRFFGDKRGLLTAVAEHGLATYIARKTLKAPHPDPVQDLRDGWDMHVEFGLANPGLFAIMSADASAPSPTLAAGRDVLRRRIRRIALTGRLKVSEARAMFLIEAACNGTVLSMLNLPATERGASLSDMAREAVMEAITGESTFHAADGSRGAASALRASLDDMPVLSDGERLLLAELLERIANAPG